MQLQNEDKICSETIKSLINELNRPGSAYVRNFSLRKMLALL